MATVYVLNKDGKQKTESYPPRCAYDGKRKNEHHGGVKRFAQRDTGLLCFC